MSPDLVVVGGGAVGLATALYAQQAGMTVTLVERQRPGHGASGHNGGIVSLGNCLPTSTPDLARKLPRMLIDPLSPLAIRWSYLPTMIPWLTRFVAAGRPVRIEQISQAMAELLSRSLSAYLPLLEDHSILESGGHLIGYATPRSFQAASFSVDVRRRRGVEFEVLGADEIAALDPALGGTFAQGLLIKGAPFVRDPQRLIDALLGKFKGQGGTLVQGDVIGFEHTGDAVKSVATPSLRIGAGVVVIAAGAWSRRLVGGLGVKLPLDTERGYGVHLPHPGLDLKMPVISGDHHLAITPAEHGALRIVGTDELAGINAPPDFRRAQRLIEATLHLFPAVDASEPEMWMSFRPSMPDSLPVIGKAPSWSNVYLAFGHGHTGFTTAAITGSIVAQLIGGLTPEIDLTPFRPERFRGGRKAATRGHRRISRPRGKYR